jgi:8-oxo-dGTP pyrophosphatase MutT (NUDIX family)
MTSAAGIVVIRNINNHPEFLGLIALKKDRKRVGGIYDIPKGQVESGEDLLVAAKRECFEESGLSPKIISEPYSNGKITVWLGIVDEEDEVIIERNPDTGLLEHEGYDWVIPETMRRNCLSYLSDHIRWAEKRSWEYFKL